jgi:hypothetical protein
MHESGDSGLEMVLKGEAQMECRYWLRNGYGSVGVALSVALMFMEKMQGPHPCNQERR